MNFEVVKKVSHCMEEFLGICKPGFDLAHLLDLEIWLSFKLKCISCDTDPFSLVPTGRFSYACSRWIVILALSMCWFWCFFSAVILLHLVTADEASELGFS